MEHGTGRITKVVGAPTAGFRWSGPMRYGYFLASPGLFDVSVEPTRGDDGD